MNVRLAAERAHILFEAEGWKWHLVGVPSVEEIEETYLDLIEMAREFESASTGRLTVLETDLGTELLVGVGTIFDHEDGVDDDREDCEHEWVDMRNSVIESGEMCPNCGRIRAAESRHALVGGQVIANVHPESACAGQHCAVHNPSDHRMADWPQHFRCPISDPFGMHPGLMERVCEHGVGHPDPDHMAWYASCHTPEETRAEGTHGCDGCCQLSTEGN